MSAIHPLVFTQKRPVAVLRDSHPAFLSITSSSFSGGTSTRISSVMGWTAPNGIAMCQGEVVAEFTEEATHG
ncbi:hypothetical protein, partial [Acetobacter indonesiensis]|uniref:hypothetical protein n=1 Tax=Acetobacter indonesiensis TaxID=104101 RepID=UPI0020A33A40